MSDDIDTRIEERLRRYRFVLPAALTPPERLSGRSWHGAWWAAAALLLLSVILRRATARIDGPVPQPAMGENAAVAIEILGPEVGARWAVHHTRARARAPIPLVERMQLDE